MPINSNFNVFVAHKKRLLLAACYFQLACQSHNSKTVFQFRWLHGNGMSFISCRKNIEQERERESKFNWRLFLPGYKDRQHVYRIVCLFVRLTDDCLTHLLEKKNWRIFVFEVIFLNFFRFLAFFSSDFFSFGFVWMLGEML